MKSFGFILVVMFQHMKDITYLKVFLTMKERGYLVIVDFDTSIPYKRENIHNQDMRTYKMQYSKLFLANPQYFLCENRKRAYRVHLN